VPVVLCEAGPVEFVVIGAGAIGGVLGARLLDAGHHVTMVARGAHLEAMQADGLRVVTPDGDLHVRPDVVGSPGAAGWGDGTIALLAVKSQDTEAALMATAHAAGAGSSVPVACVQNGVSNEPAALRWFEHVYGACVVCPALHLEPGVVEQHAAPVAGILDVGRYPDGVGEHAVDLAAAFRDATFVSEPRDDIMRWKYTKLLNNLGNAVDALCGPDPDGREIVRRAREEGEHVLRSAGIVYVSREDDETRRGARFQWGGAAARSRQGASTWQSLARGTGRIETDYLNGEIVRLGRLHRVPTPANSLLQRLAAEAAASDSAPGTIPAESVIRMLDRGE
jgi:2-dehydropantoate 2-reductase